MLHREQAPATESGYLEDADTAIPCGGAAKLVHEKTRYSNRLTAHLKMYCPHVFAWFNEIGSNIEAEFLKRWSSLDKLQRARPATIERFFIDHNSRDRERITERLEQIRKAIPATTDAAVLTSCSAAVVAWAALLKQVLAAIATYDDKIDALARASRLRSDELLPRRRAGLNAAADCRHGEPAGATQPPTRSSATAVSLLSSPAAVSNAGCIGVGLAPSSFARTFTNGHFIRSHTPNAPENTTSNSGPKGNGAIRPSAHWRSNGFVFCSAAGRSASPTTMRSISARWMHAARKKQLPAQTVELQWKNVAGFSKIVVAEA